MRWILLGALAVLAAACSSPSENEETSHGASGSGGGGAGTSGPGSGSGAGDPGTGGGGTGGGGSGSTAEIHYIGRFDTSDPAGPRFAWPGSTILTRFSGTGINVRLSDFGTNFFAVVVDEGPPTVLSTSGPEGTYTLATGLPDGEHTVYLEKRTESSLGVVQFLGFEPAGGAPLIPTPAPYGRLIELVGDSITCGYGNDGQGPACPFTADTENEFMAYGAIAARELGAAHVGISYSGIGMYRQYGGGTQEQMPVRWNRTLADDANSAWDFSYTPDVVVVNLGTNDFSVGDPGQAYVDAYAGFLEQVRGRYPDAFILCAVGSMLSDSYPAGEMHLTKATQYIQSVIDARTQAGDANVGFVDLGEQNAADGLGCDYHPSIPTHEKMAEKLVIAIQDATGW